MNASPFRCCTLNSPTYRFLTLHVNKFLYASLTKFTLDEINNVVVFSCLLHHCANAVFVVTTAPFGSWLTTVTTLLELACYHIMEDQSLAVPPMLDPLALKLIFYTFTAGVLFTPILGPQRNLTPDSEKSVPPLRTRLLRITNVDSNLWSCQLNQSKFLPRRHGVIWQKVDSFSITHIPDLRMMKMW